MSTGLIRAFWALERWLPPLRPLIWRTFYDAVCALFPDEDVHFMNWGYWPSGQDSTAIELYANTLGGLGRGLGGLEVAEVGSGRGGGASWMARTQGARSVVGIELSPRAVRLARRLHRGVSGLRFEVGDAGALPLRDESVDVVVNIESCHHYPSMSRFLSEVRRVLRPGGHLAIADYRTSEEMPELVHSLRASGLELVGERDITANVLGALAHDNDAKEAMLHARVPRRLRSVIRTFMGNRGTDVYDGFATRRWLYGSWALRKPEGGRS